MGYNGYLHPVAEGEITDYPTFFWNCIALGRRDESPNAPIVVFSWDEDYEQGKITKALDELQEAHSFTQVEWEREYAYYVKNIKSESYYSRMRNETVRIQNLRNDLSAIMEKGVHPALMEHHKYHLKMMDESIKWNESMQNHDKEVNVLSLDQFKADYIKSAERGISHAEEKYASRRERYDEIRTFINAAVETYGPPLVGIVVQSSSEML